MLLKMSEEKRLEKLQKERAKLLEATLMRPEEMMTPETDTAITTSEPNLGFLPEVKPQEKVRTRARVPLKIRQRQRQSQSPPQDIDLPSFDNPRAAFQVCA